MFIFLSYLLVLCERVFFSVVAYFHVFQFYASLFIKNELHVYNNFMCFIFKGVNILKWYMSVHIYVFSLPCIFLFVLCSRNRWQKFACISKSKRCNRRHSSGQDWYSYLIVRFGTMETRSIILFFSFHYYCYIPWHCLDFNQSFKSLWFCWWWNVKKNLIVSWFNEIKIHN